MKQQKLRTNKHIGLSNRALTTAFTGLLLIAPAWAQGTTNTFRLPVTAFSPLLQEKVRVLGNRLAYAGKERAMLVGTLTWKGVTAGATLTTELPNKVRLQTQNQGTFAIDGNSPWAAGAQLDASVQDLLESFADDSPEAIFYAIATGRRSLFILAHRARMTENTPAARAGQLLDVYDTFGLAAGQPTEPKGRKQILFDSVSQLLNHVYYTRTDSGGQHNILVVRGKWQMVQGQAIATSISRYQDGVQVLSFQASTASLGPAAADGMFTAP